MSKSKGNLTAGGSALGASLGSAWSVVHGGHGEIRVLKEVQFEFLLRVEGLRRVLRVGRCRGEP